MKSIQKNNLSLDAVIPASEKRKTLIEIKKTLCLMLIGGTLHKDESGPIGQSLFFINQVLDKKEKES